MLKVLIVDDDTEKTNDVADYVRQTCGAEGVNVEMRGSVQAGADAMSSTQFDLLIIDICLPLYESEAAQVDGGLDLLRRIGASLPGLKRPKYVIGLSAFDDTLERFHSEFENIGWVASKYARNSISWHRPISGVLVHATSASAQASYGGYEYDFAIVTAIVTPELSEVLALDCAWQRLAIERDDSIYYTGVLNADSRKLKVVAASATEMGMAASTALTMKIIELFRPRYLAMAGIAAGISGGFGDVLIADPSWDYGSGKIKKQRDAETSVFEPAPEPIRLELGMRTRLSDLKPIRKPSR